MKSTRIEDLHSYFQPIVREVERRAADRGLPIFIMEGARKPALAAPQMTFHLSMKV